MITQSQFNALAAQGHNRIPLVAQALADLDTPLSLYLKLTQGQSHSFLLESVVGGERFGRYSFVGLPARTLLRATGPHVEVVTDGQVVETFEGNPLDFIAQYQQRLKVAVPEGLQGRLEPGALASARLPGVELQPAEHERLQQRVAQEAKKFSTRP